MARGAESSPCLCSPCALEEQMGKSENGNPASRGLERVAWTSWPRTQDPRLWFPMHQTDWKRATERGLGRERPQRGSFSLKAAAAVDRSPSAAQIGHLILLVQEVQRIVTREAADGELVRHLGPVLTVGGHTFIQLCRLGEQVL